MNMRNANRFLRWLKTSSFKVFGGYPNPISIKSSRSLRFLHSRNALYDVAIIGGGAMGSSSAYFIANRRPDLRICVIERDPTYTTCSTTLSVGGIRQQFSTPENIKLSQFGFKFLSEVEEHLTVKGQDPPDINLRKAGYLILSGENGIQTLKENYMLQSELGCDISLLTQNELKAKFPWINTDGISMGSLGTGGEGFFDPWALLNNFKKKSVSLGVDYIHAQVMDIKLGKGNFVSSIQIAPNHSLQSVEQISCGMAVNASGCWSGKTANMLGIYLPVEPRKRFVYVIDCPDLVADNVLCCDTSGIYFRREGNNYLTGSSPTSDNEEPSTGDLEVDYDFFYEKIWPALAHRCPAFERLKVKSAWAGFYDYNVFDYNAVIGRHPEIENLILASGFSGHGIQHSPGTGRAVSELVLDQEFTTIDLSRLGYERIIHNDPLLEKNVIG